MNCDSEKELRKEIEYLVSLDDGYSDMVRDIQDDCMELNEVVPKVVRDVYIKSTRIIPPFRVEYELL